MKTILKAENIFKSYKIENRKIEVLKDVNFEIAEGESAVIIGASGAGKSTLLHVLSGLDYPDAGKVFFYDKEIFSQSDDEISLYRNEQIGFVFQFHYLLPEFTAVENFQVANNNAWRLRALWLIIRNCFSPTNRPEISIRRQAKR